MKHERTILFQKIRSIIDLTTVENPALLPALIESIQRNFEYLLFFNSQNKNYFF